MDGEAVTGLDMHQRVSAAVHLLLKSGVAPGNRVLITMAPSVDFFALIVAAFVVGKYPRPFLPCKRGGGARWRRARLS